MNIAKLMTLMVGPAMLIPVLMVLPKPTQASGTGVDTVYTAAPPEELFGPPGGLLTVMPSGVSVEVSFSTLGKRVRFFWRGKGGLTQNQVVETSFFPTTVNAIGRNGSVRFVISGKRPVTWSTVVEEWVLRTPLVVEEAPLNIIHFDRAAVRQVTTVYDAAVKGRDMVLNAWRDGLNEDRMLLQFWDSMDVYSLDLVSGALAIQASPTDGSAPVWQPDLAAHMHRGDTGVWSRNHVTYGVIHVMPCAVTPGAWLVLIDSNRDGTVDSSMIVDGQQWDALGFGSASSYL